MLRSPPPYMGLYTFTAMVLFLEISAASGVILQSYTSTLVLTCGRCSHVFNCAAEGVRHGIAKQRLLAQPEIGEHNVALLV